MSCTCDNCCFLIEFDIPCYNGLELCENCYYEELEEERALDEEYKLKLKENIMSSCPDDNDYECYKCGNATGHGMDNGLCYGCQEEENEQHDEGED